MSESIGERGVKGLLLSRYAAVVKMSSLERKLFAEYWRLTHTNENAPAGTEAVHQPEFILPQVEADEYERDDNQLCLEI